MEQTKIIQKCEFKELCNKSKNYTLQYLFGVEPIDDHLLERFHSSFINLEHFDWRNLIKTIHTISVM